MQNKIQDLECKLLDDRKELNALIQEFYSADEAEDKLLQCKIENLTADMDSMKQQLALLTEAIRVRESREPITSKLIRSDVSTTNVPIAEQQPQTEPQLRVEQQPQTEPQLKIEPQPQKKSVESAIGKTLMGIFASVLIFISLILFATLLYPLLNDVIKMVSMYVVSGIFLTLGLIGIKRSAKSKLAISVTSCGLGALYISLFMSSMYFKVINDITLYVLLVVWAVFTCILSRLHSKVFQIIGQIGFLISLLFGTTLCAVQEDSTQLIFVTAFFFITSLIFTLSHIQREHRGNIINQAFNLTYLFVFRLVTFFMVTDSSLRIVYVILIVYMAIQLALAFGYMRLKEESGANLDFSLVNIGYFVILNTIICSLIGIQEKITSFMSMADLCGIIIMGIAVLFLILVEKKFRDKKDVGRIVFQIYHFLIFAITTSCIDILADYVSLTIFAIPFLLYGYMKKQNMYKLAGFVFSCIVFVNVFMERIPNLVLSIVLFCLICTLISKVREQYSVVIKAITYVLAYSMFCYNIGQILDDVFRMDDIHINFIVYVLACGMNILANRTSFSKNWITKEPELVTKIITYGIHVILMIVSLCYIAIEEQPVYHILVILISLALFTMNIGILLRGSRDAGKGAYIGFKLTLLMIVCLASYSAANYIISIACFILSIASIIAGFGLSRKSFRIYGLVLSLISIVKLIMIDIRYENTIGHAFSFFACGTLCFVISMIYHGIDKKMSKQVTKQE